MVSWMSLYWLTGRHPGPHHYHLKETAYCMSAKQHCHNHYHQHHHCRRRCRCRFHHHVCSVISSSPPPPTTHSLTLPDGASVLVAFDAVVSDLVGGVVYPLISTLSLRVPVSGVRRWSPLAGLPGCKVEKVKWVLGVALDHRFPLRHVALQDVYAR